MKSIVQPAQQEEPSNSSKPEETQEKKESNATSIKVPHTSSHV